MGHQCLRCSSCTLQHFNCNAGVLEGLEECDDGNTDDGDGCSASCMVSCPALLTSWAGTCETPPGLAVTRDPAGHNKHCHVA